MNDDAYDEPAGQDKPEDPWSLLGDEWFMAPSLQVPSTPLTDEIREGNYYPGTITTVAAEGVSQHIVFDPSMKQHMVAMRASEPLFDDAGQGARWYAARRAATDAILHAVADSGFADRLVLRGSILLKTWFGDAAREPGDLDFIVEADDWEPLGPATRQLFQAIAEGAEATSRDGSARDGSAHDGSARDGSARVDAAGARTGQIWTYDRVPGCRLVLPWSADGCPDGSVQLDFVFGEKVPEPAQPLEISLGGGTPATLRAATPGLSLAWKLLWLVTDSYPQGKDLFDAVLLAESAQLSHATLQEVFELAEPAYEGKPVTLDMVRNAVERVDWDAFMTDYPQWKWDTDNLGERLLSAVEPIFAGTDGSGAGG
jgi:hypothetical protein